MAQPHDPGQPDGGYKGGRYARAAIVAVERQCLLAQLERCFRLLATRPVLFSDPVPALPLIREGKLRPLGVSTRTRLASAPEISPIAETGIPDFDAAPWTMMIGPANIPKEIVSRRHAELKSIIALPEIQRQIVKIGMNPLSSPPPEELQPFINAEIVRWSKIVH